MARRGGRGNKVLMRVRERQRRRISNLLSRTVKNIKKKRLDLSDEHAEEVKRIAKSEIRRRTRWTGTLERSIVKVGPFKIGGSDVFSVRVLDITVDPGRKSTKEYAVIVHQGYSGEMVIHKDMIRTSARMVGVYDLLPAFFTPKHPWRSGGIKFFEKALEQVKGKSFIDFNDMIIKEITVR